MFCALFVSADRNSIKQISHLTSIICFNSCVFWEHRCLGLLGAEESCSAVCDFYLDPPCVRSTVNLRQQLPNRDCPRMNSLCPHYVCSQLERLSADTLCLHNSPLGEFSATMLSIVQCPLCNIDWNVETIKSSERIWGGLISWNRPAVQAVLPSL